MARVCDICSRKTQFGNRRTYRGMAKQKGGVGIKCTGVSRRKFKPNTQKVRTWQEGGVKRLKACTRCIRGGLVRKPMKREIPDDVRDRMREKAQKKSA